MTLAFGGVKALTGVTRLAAGGEDGAAAVAVALRRRDATLALGMDGSSSGKYGC